MKTNLYAISVYDLVKQLHFDLGSQSVESRSEVLNLKRFCAC